MPYGKGTYGKKRGRPPLKKGKKKGLKKSPLKGMLKKLSKRKKK